MGTSYGVNYNMTDAEASNFYSSDYRQYLKRKGKPAVSLRDQFFDPLCRDSYSLGAQINASIGVSASGGLSINWDSAGNVKVLLSGGLGGGTPSLSATASISSTDALLTDDIGSSCNIGGSISLPTGESIGLDYTVGIEKSTNRTVSTYGLSGGIGIGSTLNTPVEMHGTTQGSVELFRFNMWDVLESIAHTLGPVIFGGEYD